MAFTIDQIVAPQTAASIRAGMVTSLVNLGVRADLWKAGGVASTMLTVVSIVLSQVNSLIATVVSGFFLPLATASGLVNLALYMYGVTAPTATFASGKLTLTNTSGNTYVKAARAMTFLNPTSKQNYVNTSGFTLGPNTTLEIDIEAIVIGTVGNAAPNTITNVVTTLTGVACTNASSVVGTDDITDADLRQLCLDSLAANSAYGPRGAYGYAIRTAVNPVTGNFVNINRFTISPNSSTGTVTIYVASPSGAPDANDVTGVGTNIEAKARPDTVTVNLAGATAVNYTRTVNVFCKFATGTSAAQVKSACDAALIDFFENYPVGGMTADDDGVGGDPGPNVGFQGVLGDAVKGSIAIAIANLGGQLISTTGATDLAMTASQVAADAVTIVPRLIQPVGGVNIS